jgi:hypothetical protein
MSQLRGQIGPSDFNFRDTRGRTGLSASQKQSIAGDDVTKLKLPNYARMCGMDDYSATRLAAHKLGRGAEFEDKMAARAQEKVSRGEPAVKPKPPGKAKHSHAHRHK